MKSREKLRIALDHEDGPIPLDFGSTGVTGMHVTCVGALRKWYGLEKRVVKVIDPYQFLGLIEDDLKEAMGIDTVAVMPPNTMFGFPLKPISKPWRAPWGQELMVSEDFQVESHKGGLLIFPQGDRSAPPSGHMPEGGFFFDTIVRQEPLDEDNLNVEDNLEEFGPLPEGHIEHFKREIAGAAQSGRGVVATFGGMAFGDIAKVPAPFLKYPKGIRDISEWYMATVTRKNFIHELFGRQLDYALMNLDKLKAVAADLVDVVFICGTDFGTQDGSFCSPATYDELWHPYYKKVNDWIHANTNWKTFKHSCGAVGNFMERFIASGFDIINPVQCSAAGMDPQTLKDKYGDRLVFWGGGVDTQHVLPFGTPEQVREQVLERCRILSKGGGFVLNAVHNVQAKTPVENIVAMMDAFHESKR